MSWGYGVEWFVGFGELGWIRWVVGLLGGVRCASLA